MASINNQSSCVDCATITSRAAHFQDDEPSSTVGGTHDGSGEAHYHAHALSHEDHEEDSPCEGNCRSDGAHDGTGDMYAISMSANPAINLRQEPTSKKPEQKPGAVPAPEKSEQKSVAGNATKKSNQKAVAENGPSEPEQKPATVLAANKPALKATTNKSTADTQPKSKRNPRRSADSSDDDDASEDSSSDEQPKAKKSVREMTPKKPPPVSSDSDVEGHDRTYECSHCNAGNDDPAPTSSSWQKTDAEFASISLRGRRRIQLCGFSNTFASYIGNEIAKFNGPARIRKERLWGLAYEIKLKGDPWGLIKNKTIGGAIEGFLDVPTGVVAGDAGSRREETFLRHMFRVMLSNGFSVHQMTQSIETPGTFYFEKFLSRTRTIETMTIAFHNPNRVRVTCAPQEFVDALENLLEKDLKFKGERTKTQKPRERREKKRAKQISSPSKTSKKAEEDAAEYVVPRVSWQTHHVWFGFAPMSKGAITNAHQFKLKMMKILREQGWKPVTSLERSFRSNSKGTEHVACAWYYQREKPVSEGKQLGLAGNMLQRVVGGSSKVTA